MIEMNPVSNIAISGVRARRDRYKNDGKNWYLEIYLPRSGTKLKKKTFLNGLPHSKHVSSQDVCLIYSREKYFLASTAT